MTNVFSAIDIALSVAVVCIGSYYLWRNRENQSYLRIAIVLVVGAVALDMLYTVYGYWNLSIGVTAGQRSATILVVKGAIGALCSVLAFCPGKCELPALHHLSDTDMRKCVAVRKVPAAYNQTQLTEAG